ncbi:hypothetical protein F8154_02700 [Alkaliphilus pronyensis]|uniref:SurA N-terminal domain-containing protein n=1 Tax=Alkaliphilus pronyensis TaxID=1482732 RepID=A0A6I0FEQ1_9FIRM|nr:hypothetical protein [Alkaliphilus pronyensis]KAB3537736.1 hypothetical protein F8154_02700 [Alkaliphilus pronyensis]
MITITKTKHLIIAVLLIAIILALFSFVQASKDENSINEVVRKVQVERKKLDKLELDDASKTVLQIDDIKISKKHYELTKTTLNTDDKKEIEDFIINRTIQRIIAKEKGIKVSKEEVLDYIAYLKEIYKADEESRELATLYFQTYGFNEETFWESQLAYDMYADFLLLSKFRYYIFEEVSENNSHLSIETNKDKLDMLVKSRIEELVDAKKASITIKTNN